MDHYRSCDNCQRMGNLVHTNLAKLITMLPTKLFTKWGIDFIGPIKSTGHYTCNRYVLVVIDYSTKWVEAKVLRNNTTMVTTWFLYKFILMWFSCPLTLVNNQGMHFINDIIQILTTHFLNIQVPLPTTHRGMARLNQVTKSLAYSSPN